MKPKFYHRKKFVVIKSDIELLYNNEPIKNWPNRNDRDLIIINYVFSLRKEPSDKILFEFSNFIGNSKIVEDVFQCKDFNHFKTLLKQLFDKYFLEYYKDYLESLFNPPEQITFW